MEPATRYILRSSSWNGSSHTYTYSTFVTDQEHEGHIVDYGPFTMEATLVDMMYEADNPAAVNRLIFNSDNLAFNQNGGSADTITVSTDASFDNSISDLDGNNRNWGLTGIMRESRLRINGVSTDDILCLDSATDSTATTLTLVIVTGKQ